jgi:hypothetical protein
VLRFAQTAVAMHPAWRRLTARPRTRTGRALSQQDVQIQGVAGPFIVERPKVLYNSATKTFVMWFHLDMDGYRFRHAGVATSPNATGPFQFVHALQPDGVRPAFRPGGASRPPLSTSPCSHPGARSSYRQVASLDMSLFRDPVDQQAYFIRSCNNAYTGISRLSADYLTSSGMISNHSVFEGMALFRHPNGTYYVPSASGTRTNDADGTARGAWSDCRTRCSHLLPVACQ